MRNRRLVRLHLVGDLPSLEGVLRTYRTARNGNHYILELVKVIQSPDASLTLEGEAVRVPREQVAFIQEL